MADNNFSETAFSADAQKQLEQYKTTLDNLRLTIANLNNPIKNLSASVSTLNENVAKATDTYSKLDGQNQSSERSFTKVKETVENLKFAFEAWDKVLKIVRSGAISLESALTGGLAILTVFGPEILQFAKSLFQGKEAIDQSKLSIENLNKALGSSDYSNANKQLNELKINVGLAKTGFLQKRDVLKQYNETLGKSMGHASSLSEAEDKLTKNGPAYIKMTLYKATAQLALQDAAKKAYEAEQIKLKSDDDVLTFWDKVVDVANHNPGAAGIGSHGATNGSAEADKAKKQQAAKRRAEAVKEAEEQKKAAEKIANTYQKLSAQIAKDSKLNFWPGETNDGTETTHKKRHKKNAKSKPDTSRPTEILEAHMSPILTTFEEEKKLYDKEVAALDEKLGKQLISQTEYNAQSKQLQEKYHQGISLQQEEFNKNQMTVTMQHLKDVAEADRLQKAIGQDEKELNKAILPGQQLDAEKKLIADKYDYEITLAGGNTEKIKQLELDKQKALTDVANQYEQQRKEFALNTAQQVADKAFSIIGNNIKATSDAKLKGLETQKAGELSNTSLTATQRKAIEDKYKKKEAEEKLKAFKSEQRASLLQAIVNGALAVTKVTAQTGVFAPFVIPGIIASTALQVATILAQKPPAFARGGHFVSDGRGAVLPGYSRTDNTNAYLRSGEAVVVSEAMRNPWARNLVSAINVAHGGRDFSVPNTGRGYAIGGIYTDGGNANRYYNQPVNDAKELANTLAYQMINNFPPIYVDVKDVNNQQNILAQTVNRVNL